ncbi:glycosyltransferase family 2 protein [Rathayibacter sp. AY2B3]|uniref:glycosyltransferase family 2 protein n=1 Tax=Rathayibacter sp. AY2B3 TaxID=2080569 RepID=UPI0021581146|nr:glycosyltransferase family 2 protein [Rathayibacter sp. AY2B3]
MVNYASAELVRALVASLRDEPVDSIRVLENGSGPEQVRILEEVARSDERMQVSVSPTNLGFGAGVNRLADSVEAPDEDVLWILNPDTVVAPGCVAVLEEHLATHPRTIASPLILDATGGVWFAGGELSLPSGRSTHSGYGRSPDGLPTRAFPTRFMTGAAMTTTMTTWHALGGFRDDLFLYWEDSELSVRASRSGIELTVVPQARIMHLEGGSSSAGIGRSTTYYYYYAFNRIRVCSQYTRKADLLLGRGLIETLRSVVKPLFKEKSGRVAKTRASLRGMLSGIRAPRLHPNDR